MDNDNSNDDFGVSAFERVQGMALEFQMRMRQQPSPELQASLITEEICEAEEALSNLLKEIADLSYVIAGSSDYLDATEDDPDPTFDVVPDISPLLYLIINALDPDFMVQLASIVHRSNLSKLDDNGNPIYDEHGKVMKGPNYRPPNMAPMSWMLEDPRRDNDNPEGSCSVH